MPCHTTALYLKPLVFPAAMGQNDFMDTINKDKILAVTRQGTQSFVFVAKNMGGHIMAVQTPVTLGDTVGNQYSITAGLNAGDKVIVSGTQFLVNNMPVMPMGG